MPTDRAAVTLTELIARLGTWGERPAIRAMDAGGYQQWTYAELHHRAARFAAGLGRRGIGTGDHVVLMAPNRPEWIAVCLGTISAGAVLVPLDSQLDGDSLAHVLGDCAPALIVTTARAEARLRAVVEPGVPIALLDASPDDTDSWLSIRADEHPPVPPVTPERIAVLFYTSGTTGMPKGVPLSHRNLAFQVETLLAIGLVEEGDRVLLALPLHHVYPFAVGMLGSLAYGVTLVLPQAINGPQVLRALRDGGVTTVIGVPRLYEVLLTGLQERVRAGGRLAAMTFGALLNLSILFRRFIGLRIGRRLFAAVHRNLGPDVRMFASGGAALAPETAWALEGLGWIVTTGYGMTETAPLIAIVAPGSTSFDSAGRLVPGIETRIRHDASSAPSAPGEIEVRGPGVFTGYHNLPSRTAEAFTDDGWFRTEDLGCLDSRGRLHVFGRASSLIVTEAGENLLPEEIEEAYERDPAIREVGVLYQDRMLVAVVVPALGALRRQDQTDVEAAIRQAVSDIGRSLPSTRRLADFVISRDVLPRTRLGKIRRAALRRRYDGLNTGLDAVAVGPLARSEMTDEDRELLDHPAMDRIWQWLASRYPDRRLGPDSHVALDLGIDSLEWIDVTLEIQRLTGAEITEEATGRIETVRDLLLEVIDSSGRAPRSGEVPAANPEAILSERQRRWLAPLSWPGRLCGRLLHGATKLVVGLLFGLRVEGKGRLPPCGPFVLAPNHASVLDPFVLGAALDYDLLRNSYWAGWTGMAFANPLFRFVSRMAQVLPIEQDRAATSSLALGETVLRRGNNLIWFPEGARTRTGELQPFRLGIGLLLRQIAVPVVPVWIDGTFEAMPPGRRLPRPRRVRVTFGESVTVENLEARGNGETPDARLVDGLRSVVVELAKRARELSG